MYDDVFVDVTDYVCWEAPVQECKTRKEEVCRELVRKVHTKDTFTQEEIQLGVSLYKMEPYTDCRTMERLDCKKVKKEYCKPVTKTEVEKVSREECKDIQRERCETTHIRTPKSVSTQQQVKVCDDPNISKENGLENIIDEIKNDDDKSNEEQSVESEAMNENVDISAENIIGETTTSASLDDRSDEVDITDTEYEDKSVENLLSAVDDYVENFVDTIGGSKENEIANGVEVDEEKTVGETTTASSLNPSGIVDNEANNGQTIEETTQFFQWSAVNFPVDEPTN